MRAALVFSACLAFGATARADGPKTNVLLILADDLRPELGCYGSPAKTPHLDAFAKTAVRFDRAYCQQALCNPSRSSFLTGLRPDALRLWSNGTHFRERAPDVVTLPGWFKAAGYATLCVGKVFHNWHTKVKGDRPSWSADEFLHYATHGHDAPKVKGKLPPNLARPMGRDYLDVPLCERRDVPDDAYYDGRVADEAVRVLGTLKDRPFFLAVGFWKPHAPFNAPKRYWDLYDPKALPPLRPDRPKDAPALAFHDSREILGISPDTIRPDAGQVEQMRHGYFANVSYMDAMVGRVLKALADARLDGRTVVVFVSDHGYHLGEHTLWAKTSCFEFDARVPLLVRTPGTKAAGRATSSLAELVDLFPTLAQACGVGVPKGLQGESLLPVLDDPTKAVKSAAFTQHPRPAYFDRTDRGVPEAMGYSVRTPAGRYTQWREWATGKVTAEEFYDHPRDAAELTNRASAGGEAMGAARRALLARFPAKR